MSKRCIGCMQLIEDSENICPHCGYNQSDYHIKTHQLPVGTELQGGTYYIGRVIGEGGFGITYMGWDKKFSCVVAIKEFYAKTLANRHSSFSVNIEPYSDAKGYEKALKKVEREAVIMNQFSGLAGITNVKDFFKENNTVYIIMEYVQGVTLKEYINSHGAMDTDKCLELFKPLIKSIASVHKSGVIHRDISLDNIMIQDNTSLKLLDFGAARPVSSETESITVKIGYAPPEQYSTNRNQHGPWIDVYSLCVCMYSCLTGKLLSEAKGQKTAEDLWRDVDGDIDVKIKKVLSKGLEPDYRKRIQSMDELYAALYSDAQPGSRRPRKPPKKGSKIIFLIVAVLVLYGIGMGCYILFNSTGYNQTLLTDTVCNIESGEKVVLEDIIPISTEYTEYEITAQSDNTDVVSVISENDVVYISGIDIGTAVVTYKYTGTASEEEYDDYSGEINVTVSMSQTEKDAIAADKEAFNQVLAEAQSVLTTAQNDTSVNHANFAIEESALSANITVFADKINGIERAADSAAVSEYYANTLKPSVDSMSTAYANAVQIAADEAKAAAEAAASAASKNSSSSNSSSSSSGSSTGKGSSGTSNSSKNTGNSGSSNNTNTGGISDSDANKQSDNTGNSSSSTESSNNSEWSSNSGSLFGF